MGLQHKCEELFNTTDFYAVLQIDRSASQPEVKKAYHKQSLLVHPDRVPDAQKLDATEKFKVVSNVYTILSDPDKRAIYDETGSYDAEDDEVDFGALLTMWRNLFPKITVAMLDSFKAKFINSEGEREDIRKAYESTRGNMTEMHDLIPFMCVADEERIIGIVREMVDSGVVQEYDGFFNESKAKKARRKRKEQSTQLSDVEVAAMMEACEQRQRESESRFTSFIANLESKYAKPRKAIKKAKPIANGRVTKKKKVAKKVATKKTKN